MEKRLILAISISLFIIIGYQYLVVRPNAPTRNAKPVECPSSPAPSAKAAPEATNITTKPALDEKLLEAETDRYVLTFSSIGGSLKKIVLKDFKASDLDGKFVLADIKNPDDYLLSINDVFNPLTLANSNYNVTKKDNEITYSLRLKDLDVVKKYILHKAKYLIELQVFIRNTSSAPKEISYSIITGSGINEPNMQDKRFVEVTSKIDGKFMGFKHPKDKRITNLGTISWIALKNKYFSEIVKPFVATKGYFYSENKNKMFISGIEMQSNTIPPNSFIENKFQLFAGPSQISVLKSVGYEFDETVNYGFFGGISKALLAVLRFFYSLVHNWGVSVILMAVFLNIILFPLTNKSFKSMQKMQELHPQMEKLKAQNKDNPQKLNKEIMELYKKYNINPFSGCLPLLLQMPIFFALYQALIKSIELRCSSFLWIKDLSMPDAVQIPFTLPLIGNHINILPILMIAATVVQQKFSTKTMGSAVTAEQKQQQKMMLFMMPVMFGIIFYNMPSGLVLYWLVNTVLTVVEQFVIFKPATLTN